MKNIDRTNALQKIKELKNILVSSSNNTPLDLSNCIEKLDHVITSASDIEIKIVLLGAFSDGKTSTIAGLLGEIMDDMKIDSDESSDQIEIYRPKNLKNGFVILDTPGLFGTKEKEVDVESVKLSDITERYISEAHIILYVTSAVAPIKDSHSNLLKKVLRDLNKLDDTIFVLNKMDETGINITKDDAYKRMSSTKIDFVKSRLRDIINLTNKEADSLKIACISADPKRKGIESWLKKPSEYSQLSRIGELETTLREVVKRANVDQLRTKTYEASLKDVFSSLGFIICGCILPLRKKVEEFKEDLTELEKQLNNTYSDLLRSKALMKEQIDFLRKRILEKINDCSFEEMGGVLRDDLGIEGDKVTFYALEANVNSIVNSCSQSNQSSLSFAETELKAKFDNQDNVLEDSAKKGLKIASESINNKTVLAARDMFFKSHKFKPYGATKLAGKITVGISAALALWDVYGRWKRNKELKKMKAGLNNAVNGYFSKLYKLINSDDDYINNFASRYIDMKSKVKERKQECTKIEDDLDSVESLKTKISAFFGQDIEYAEFEEI